MKILHEIRTKEKEQTPVPFDELLLKTINVKPRKAKNRDPQLEKAGLLSRLHASTFLSNQVKRILKEKVGMSPKELDAHIQLWEDVSKYLIDPEGKITEIFDRSRAKSPENPIGYLINGLKGEVEQAKKRTESKIQQPSLFDQPQVEVANFNDGESLMKSINSVESKTKNKHYKTTFTKEQLQETFSEVDMGMSIHDWALSLGYKYDETKEVYYK